MSIVSDLAKAALVVRSGASLVDRFSSKPKTDNSEFSTNSFLSKISAENGLMNTNRFLITLDFPLNTKVGKQFLKFNDDRMVQFLAKNTILPGLSFTTTEIRRFGSGPMTFYPSNVTFPELPITFYVDGNSKMIDFLYGWFQTVANFGGTGGESKVTPSGQLPYEMNYFDEYKCRGTITVFDKTNEKIIEYTLTDLVPSSMADISLDWASEEMMSISATFRYTSFEIEKLDVAKPVTKSRGLSAFEKLSKTLAIGQTIGGAARIPRSIGDVVNLASNAQLIQQNFNYIK